jgi:pimeloyl-ACP methyl ester carboxylesterase
MHTSFSKKALLSASVFAAAFALSSFVFTPVAVAADTSAKTAYTHQTAPTQFIDANGTKLAYRRFGKAKGVPLIMLQHFVGNMDSWDPKVVDGLARDRQVVLFDNAGVASSDGEVPKTVEGMAAHAINLMTALGIKKADLLGFSLGSLVAQEVALERPELVRRLIIVGSGPRGGVGMATLTPEFQAALAKKHEVPDELLLDVFFTPTPKSQAAGREFLKRLRARTVNRDGDINDKVAQAQVAAFAAWGAPSANAGDYLKKISQPTLVISGSNDIVHYTINSFNLQQSLPNAQLIVYPDTNHGSLYQYPDLFLTHVRTFLD